MVEKFGFQEDISANGKEVPEVLEKKEYNVVLMDVQMPEMDGSDATKRIRDIKSKVIDHDIPIIVMTAHAIKGDKERCINTGMNDYISKPLTPKRC